MNLRFPYLLLLVIIGLHSCQKKNELIPVTRQVDGNIEHFFVSGSDTSKKQGLYVLLTPKGDTLEKMFYENGLLEGVRTVYSPDGHPYIIEHYKAGNYDGPYEAYYENGLPRQKGQYVNNLMEGVWITYYKEYPGMIKEEVTFARGVENGPFKEYHPNGKLAAEGMYKDEFEDGELKVYDTSGTLRKIYIYKDKKPVETINVP